MWNENGLNANNRLRVKPLKLELTETVQEPIAAKVNLDVNQLLQRTTSALSRNQITAAQALDEFAANGIEMTVANNEGNVVASSNNTPKRVRIVTNNPYATSRSTQVANNEFFWISNQYQNIQVLDFIDMKVDKLDVVFVGNHPTIINHDKYEDMGTEFDKTVTKEEALEELKKVKDTYVKYYKDYQDCPLEKSVLEGLFDCATYGISSSFLSKDRVNLSKQEIPESVNLKEFLSKIISNFKELVESSKALQDTTYTSKIYRIIDGSIEPEVKTNNIFDRKNVVSNFNSFLKDDTESSMLGEYIKNMFNSKFYELGFNNMQREAFISIIFREVAIRNDELEMYKTCSYNIEPYMLVNAFNKNGSYWLFEFEKFVNQEFAKVGKIDNEETANATEIHPNFLGDSTKILKSLNDMILSSDPGERKFAEIIKKAFVSYGCTDFKSQEHLLKFIIKLLNTKSGVDYEEEFPPLSESCIENLNNSDVFQILKDIIKSDTLFNCAVIIKNDDAIGNFKQGGTGDCWLLAAIDSLSKTPAGAELIKDSIKWNKDCTAVDVYFAGLGITVSVSAEEIIDAKGTKYSRGDDDVLILELAMEKIMGDINNDFIEFDHGGFHIKNYRAETFFRCFIPNGTLSHEGFGEALDGITDYGLDDVGSAINGVFGGDGKLDLSESKVEKFLKKLYEAKQAGKNICATFALCTTGNTTYSWRDGFGKEEFDLGESGRPEAHQFSIVDITSSSVTFANPHDTSKTYTLLWGEFANIGIAYLDMATF